MDRYREHVNKKFKRSLKTTKELQRWSVDSAQDFWCDLYGYLELQPPLPSTMRTAYDQSLPMSKNPEFFQGHMVNYAENALLCQPR